MIKRIIKLCSRLGVKRTSQHKKVSTSMPEEPQSSFPALVIGATTQPAYDQVVFLLFLINSDGVINY